MFHQNSKYVFILSADEYAVFHGTVIDGNVDMLDWAYDHATEVQRRAMVSNVVRDLLYFYHFV